MALNFSVYPYQIWCFTLPKKEIFFLPYLAHLFKTEENSLSSLNSVESLESILSRGI